MQGFQPRRVPFRGKSIISGFPTATSTIPWARQVCRQVGVWIIAGCNPRVLEAIKGTPNGVLKDRHIKRLAKEESRWHADSSKGVICTPMGANPGQRMYYIQAIITMIPERTGPIIPHPELEDRQVRRVQKHRGYTIWHGPWLYRVSSLEPRSQRTAPHSSMSQPKSGSYAAIW